MAKMTIEEVYQLVAATGWRGDDAVTMTAVVMAESSGVTDAKNPAGTGVGLFQINPRAHGAEWNLKGLDPRASAQFAYQLWRSRGFQPWEAYTNGKYLSFLVRAKMAAEGIGSGGPFSLGELGDVVPDLPDVGSAVGGIASAFQAIVHTIGAVVDWISDRNNWFRVIKVVAGGALVVAALNVAVRPAVMDAVGTATGRKGA